MISFTLNYKDLKFPMPNKFKYQIEHLFERADKLRNGYITIKLSLPAKYGTDQQNKTFHALLNEFFLSGCSRFDSVFEMRNYFKLLAGGAKYYIYFIRDRNGNLIQKTCEKISQIPQGSHYVKVPKSWVDFNREERAKAIDLVIHEGILAGCNTEHWNEILGGIESNGK